MTSPPGTSFRTSPSPSASHRAQLRPRGRRRTCGASSARHAASASTITRWMPHIVRYSRAGTAVGPRRRISRHWKAESSTVDRLDDVEHRDRRRAGGRTGSRRQDLSRRRGSRPATSPAGASPGRPRAHRGTRPAGRSAGRRRAAARRGAPRSAAPHSTPSERLHIPDTRYPELGRRKLSAGRGAAPGPTGRCGRRSSYSAASAIPTPSSGRPRAASSPIHSPAGQAVQVDRQVGVDEEVLVPRDGAADAVAEVGRGGDPHERRSSPRRRRPARRGGTRPPPARAHRSRPGPGSSPSRTRSSAGPRFSNRSRRFPGPGVSRSSGGSANSMSATRIRSAVARTTSVSPASTRRLRRAAPSSPGARCGRGSSIGSIGTGRSSSIVMRTTVRRRSGVVLLEQPARATPRTGRRAARSGPTGRARARSATKRVAVAMEHGVGELVRHGRGAYGERLLTPVSGFSYRPRRARSRLLDGKVALDHRRRVGPGPGGVGAVRRARRPHRRRRHERRRRGARRSISSSRRAARPSPCTPTCRGAPTTTPWSHATVDAFGAVDVLYNNAAIQMSGRLVDVHRGAVGHHDRDEPQRDLLGVPRRDAASLRRRRRQHHQHRVGARAHRLARATPRTARPRPGSSRSPGRSRPSTDRRCAPT